MKGPFHFSDQYRYRGAGAVARSRVCALLYTAALLLLFLPSGHAQSGQLRLDLSIDWAGKHPVLSVDRPDDRIDVTLLRPGAENPALAVKFPMRFNDVFSYSLSGWKWLDDNTPFDAGMDDLITANTAVARKQRFGLLEIPIVKSENGRTYKVEGFELSVLTRPGPPQRPASRTFASESVLRTGDWYKFGIPETGVYKLSYEFLVELGLDPQNIPHTSFRVYGHKGGMLPKRAGDERTDDLVEIPVAVVASGSSMRPGDYIVFYGEGPESWTWDEAAGRFRHEQHLYSDNKTYLITASLGTGLRVPRTGPPAGTPDLTLNSFLDYRYFEEDLYNLNKSGSDWLGREFAVSLSETWSFTFPNVLPTEPVTLDYRVAARSTSGSSSFDIQYDSEVIKTSVIGAVGSSYTSPVGASATSSVSFLPVGDRLDITLRYNPSNFAAKGWLDYLAVNARRALTFDAAPLYFRDPATLDNGLVQFNVGGVSGSVEIWDVTDLFDIRSVDYTLQSGSARFNAEGGRMAQYAAFTTPVSEPVALGSVPNQNLHALSDADYIIITRESMLGQASDLAAFHAQEEGMAVHVVTVAQIFNEFSSGTNDITALRDFLKMFYDRNDNYPKYVCLFGDGTFNNRELGSHYVPTYEGEVTLNTLGSLVSDDYFVFLDDDEGDNIDNNTSILLDMGIGRIPADNGNKASIAVEKIKRYYSGAGYGSWRNVGAFVADDEDLNIHIDDAEIIANEFIRENPVMNISKIYLDAYNQVAGAGGGRYPDVNQAINNRVFKGTMFLNYIGHGSGNGLAEEQVVTLENIESWDNPDKLTLIISATCEFTRYDDFERYSAGERAFFKSDGGAIALVTTVRLVFSNQNFEMNQGFMDALELGFDDPELKLGDILLEAKNNTPTGRGNRKFTLIGDPALRLAFPDHRVQTTRIDSEDFVPGNDTLKALTLVNIEGEVRTAGGQLMTDFNGLVYPTVYDKVKTQSTLGNDERSVIIPFQTQNSIIYAGKIQATAGRFQYAFVVPKDIVYTVGDGKISYYAHDEARDAAGIDTVLIGSGGDLDSNSIDNDDPLVEVFIDDESWISGDFTDPFPNLFVKLYDDNGINTVGSGVGHDIVAVLDEETQNGIVLNDFYESELNSYQAGEVLYPLEEIEVGTHTVRVKAWDVFNNSGEGMTEFVVADDAGLALDHVLNYPNPFTTSTLFMFEHNRKGDMLDVRIEVFTVSGKIVKTLQETAVSSQRRVEVAWDGLDDYGDRLGKGVYIYRVTVKDSSGEKVDKFQKLVLLR